MWDFHRITEFIKISGLHSLFEQQFNSDYNFSGESHDFWECVYVIEGSICVNSDTRIYNMEKGCLIFHKPLELHKFYIDSPNGARLLIFSFDLHGASDFFKDKVFLLNREQLAIMNSFLIFLHSMSANKQTIPKYTSYLDKLGSSETYSQLVVIYIYQLFLSLYNENNIYESSKHHEAIIFSDAVNYMNSNISRFPSVEEIARCCCVGVSSLKRIFSKYAGCGVHKYLLALKLNTASLLIKKGISISEISERLGFSSQGYFSAVYKRETGYSPTQYKSSRIASDS